MKFLKTKILFILLFSFFSLVSFAASPTSFDEIIFFGDSLSDNGNLYNLDLGLLPKSPPYFEGRFSNGPVWSELLAANFLQNKNISSLNYAVGGETANFYNPPVSLLPYDLTMSIYDYFLKHLLTDKSHTLFIIWIGGNDYLGNKVTDAEKLTTGTVNAIQTTVETIIARGGKTILMVNLPDLGKIPYAKSSGTEEVLSQLTVSHNAKLKTAVEQIQKNHSDVAIHLFDMYSLFEDLEANIDSYNKKYGLHVSNLTDACWKGGNMLSNRSMAQSLQMDFNKNPNTEALSQKINFSTMAAAIQHNPVLSTAYNVGQGYAIGVVPCSDPDAYVFWDSVHPSNVIHTVISKIMTDYINQNFS